MSQEFLLTWLRPTYDCKIFPAEDVEDINTLMRQLSLDGSVRTVTAHDCERMARQPHVHTLFVRVRQDHRLRIVGMGSVVLFETPMHMAGFVEDVVVHSDFRKQALGEQIVSALLTLALSHGCSYAELTTSPQRIEANRLYQKLLFQRRGTNLYRYTFP